MKNTNERKMSMMEKLSTGIAVILIAWIALSYAEIMTKNLNPDPTYSRYNVIASTIYKVGNK